MSCGIYKITNLINNKVYIGQSVDIEKRWSAEKSGSCNKMLKEDFNSFGIENFKFEILEECSQPDLNKKEIFYIKLFNSVKNGYNISIGGNGWRKYENSLEHETEYNRKYNKEYRQKNKERIKQQAKEYRKRNKDYFNKLSREKRKSNPEYYKEIDRRKREIHPEEVKIWNKKSNDRICYDPITNEFVKYSTMRGRLKNRTGSEKGVGKYVLVFYLTKQVKCDIIKL